MNPYITKLLMALAVVTSIGASQANADEYSRIDRDARRIERKTKLLLKETKHYKSTANYQVMVDSCLQLKSFATHVHDVSHFEGNLVHLKEDIKQLDYYLHATEDLFDQTEVNAANGYGCIKGNTRHVKRLLEDIDKSICRMQENLKAICECLEATPVLTPVITQQVMRPVVITREVFVPARAIELRRTEYTVPRYGSDIGYGRDYGIERGYYGSGCPSRGYGHR